VRDHATKVRMASYFYKADQTYGTAMANATHLEVSEVSALAAKEMSH